MIIYDKINAQLPAWRDRVSRLVKNYGSFKVCDVTVEQIYGGIRGVQIQVSDISYVDPPTGIRLRGYTVPEILQLLPKARGSEFPLAGGLYYLLMANELPDEEQAWMVENEWKKRADVPGYVFDMINAMPPDTHPMTLFSQAVLAMQHDSVFSQQYYEGVLKNDYWKYYLEDSMNLTARLPVIAAYIYNKKYRNLKSAVPHPDLDWAANFGYMIGKGDDREYQDLSRLFLILHSDHEGGNVSAHAAHLVGSALSDVYYACSAGLDGLAGPLHGLANQECIRWLLSVREAIGNTPTEAEFEAFAWSELKAGKLLPGYGHAVLRTTDPRFTAQLEFGEKYMPDDELFQLVKLIYKVLPGVLMKHGKVKNPWPNVDAINGTMQYHYGVTQFDFYTVLFGLSRVLGFTAHLVWARVLGKPIERPKSLTTRMLEDMVSEETS
jgi:citrate synthase